MSACVSACESACGDESSVGGQNDGVDAVGG